MYALGFDPVRELEEAVAMYAGPDVFHVLTASLGGKSARDLHEVFDAASHRRAVHRRADRDRAVPTVHRIETYGLRISADGKTAVYTSDTACVP